MLFEIPDHGKIVDCFTWFYYLCLENIRFISHQWLGGCYVSFCPLKKYLTSLFDYKTCDVNCNAFDHNEKALTVVDNMRVSYYFIHKLENIFVSGYL